MSFVGVDLGRSNLRVGLFEDGKIRRKLKRPTQKDSSKVLSREIINLIEELEVGNVERICITCVGRIDPTEGTVHGLSDLPSIPIRERLQGEFSAEVELVNDCSAAVIAEHINGAGKGLENIVYLTISSGIGAGAVVDGEVLFGKNLTAAEAGHFVVQADSSLRCSCGKRGHWEGFCSGEGIPNFIRELIQRNPEKAEESPLVQEKSNLSAELVFKEAKKGDDFASFVTEEMGKLNAAGTATIINAYDPELITVGGSVALNNPELVLNPLKEYLDQYKFNEVPEIKITPFGGEIVLEGACLIASNPALIQR